ncbi:MAG: hypothetical protein JWN78_1709 [Bacteroidota bacterium]|nr:hypothetical protein [Bacteroidota bacterium]
MRKKYLYFSFLLFVLSCKKESSVNTFTDDPSILQDQYGRQLIIHGVNTTGSAKADPERQPWIQESDVQREADSFGFSADRYLIFWDAIEPQQGVFDETYLDKIEQRVNWYAAHNMHVFLDMHQDLYSIEFGGDGAPAWALRPNGYPVNTNNPYGTAWFLKSLDPAVSACFQNFWQYTTYKELQDHYMMAWKKVAERFKNNPAVIGYDLMNEPYAGDLVNNLNGNFELGQLRDFYKRLITAIRTVDNDKYLFFEPTSLGVNNGLASALQKVSDTRSIPHLAYAPHCYPLFVEAVPGPYDAPAHDQLISWETQRTREMKKYNCPLIVGEFGLSPTLPGYSDFLNDLFVFTDSVQAGWTYWANDHGGWAPLNVDGTESPIMQWLIRTYPKAVAGRIKRFTFERSTKKFNLTYLSNSAISHPTEIFVPSRYYPNGWNLSVTGTAHYTQEFDAAKQLLKVSTTESAKVTIEITAK